MLPPEFYLTLLPRVYIIISNSNFTKKTSLAWIILSVGLLTTVLVSLQVKQNVEQAAVKQFAFSCDQITLKLQEHLEAYALVLKGSRAFFAGSSTVERQEWKAYIDSLQVEQSIPGIQGIGFAKVIPAAQLARHIAQIRGEGFPDYTVHPPGERSLYTAIIYIEPFTDRNLRAFGFDMYAEPVRRLAMEQARDTGETALSGKVELVQETGTDVQAGVLMYLPVYRIGAPVDTVGQRQAALQGWVYSPYRMNDLMLGLLTDWERHDGKIVNLVIYDNQKATPANRLFTNLPTRVPDVHSLFYQQRIINVKGRQWLLVFDHTKKSFAISYGQVLATLICGFALSGLLFGLMRSITNTQANAVGIANKLTEKIQLLLSSAAEAIYGIDLNGDCTFCNDACLKMLGYAHYDDLLGKNMHWQIHGKHEDGTIFPVEDCPIFQAFEKGERIHVNNEVLWRVDGSCFAAEYWSYPQIHEGLIIGAVVTFIDITERKQDEALLIETNVQLQTEIQERKLTEKALRGSENRFRVIADNAPVLIWMAGLDKGCYFFNKVWLQFTGRSLQQEQGNGWTEGVHPEDFQFCLDIYLTAFDARQEFVMEYRLRRFDGEYRWLLDNGVPYYDENNTFLGFIGSCIDITERKNLDVALLNNNIDLENAKISAEKANLAKSEFLSSMSHELRSPLNAILGFAQLLESDSPPPSQGQAESIVQILEAGWHLLKLINDILDLAKIESGHTALSQESLSLNDVIFECTAMMEPKSQKFGIPIIIPPIDTQYVVYADRIRLKQVLINLLSNAIKYNSKQGTVEVQCTETTPGYGRVSVQDIGAGLSPKQLAQLFQPFNRLGQEAGNREGTGIGLIVAKQLIELMGGVIGVNSRVGTGSVFWIELPLMTEPHPNLEKSVTMALPSPQKALEAPQQTLLYVEDNPANMKLVEQIIARQPNRRLLTADNATSGIQMARDYQPEVILMDINLPGINGIEALHILRSDPSTAHLTVIALSANAMPHDIENGLKAGFFSYMTKPINIKEFMATLDTALEFANKINHGL